MAEMPGLEGEERVLQEKRVKDLLDAANEQQARFRDGTLLKHKLMCSEPTSLAVLMAKADNYATADSAMRVKVTASDKAVPTPTTPKPVDDNQSGHNNNKRKADQLDSHSNNKLVANVKREAPTTQAGSQRRRTGKNDWQPKLSFEQMLDTPCKMHSGAKPSTHTFDNAALYDECRKGRARRLPQDLIIVADLCWIVFESLSLDGFEKSKSNILTCRSLDPVTDQLPAVVLAG
ncbi:hypothetical protein D1007_44864 [Hordeum vulgare]|nr:hypothetical protein D1007_44864 [Hordeum vulgare]